MKSLNPLYGLLMLFCIISLSSGIVSGRTAGGESAPEGTPPIIISHLEGNDIVKFWAGPDQIVSVLYDRWEIFLFSQDADKNYSVVIGGTTVYNGTMEAGYLNITHNARNIDITVVKISIGNRTYIFRNVRVNHEDIGYNSLEEQGAGNIYSISDMNMARFRTAIGVIISSVLTIPIVWKGVKTWRNKQGVVQW